MKTQPKVIFPLMVLLFFSIAFITGLNNPFSKVIQEQFSLSNFQSQFGALSFFVAYFFLGVPSSILVEHLGYKRATQTALLVALLSLSLVLLGGNAGYIWLYLLGMFLLGCAITVLQVVVNPVIVAAGDEQKANARMNLGGAASSLGATLAPIIVGFIIGNVASLDSLAVADVNPLLYCIMTIILAVFIIVSFIPFPDLNLAGGNKEKINLRPLLNAQFLFGILAIFVYVGLEVATPNITNLFMINELAVDAATAGAVVGTYWLLMFAGRLVGVAVGTGINSRVQLIFVSAIALMLYVFSILLPLSWTVTIPAVDSHFKVIMTTLPVSVVMLVLVGFFESVMWTCIFILATHGMGKNTNLASGVFMMMVCGGGIIPALQGRLADTFSFTGSYTVGVVCLSVILLYAIFVKQHKVAA